MKSCLRALTCLLILNLTGCSFISGTASFRNRELDYTRQPLTVAPPLQTPANLSTPAFDPTFQLPPGPNEYPAGNPPVMTPPGFSS